MAYTAPNPVPYPQSYPITSRLLTIKRGDGTTPGGGTATTVGTFLAENCSIGRTSGMVDRIGINGEDQGAPTIIRKKSTWSSKVQVDALLTNSIRPGDFFEESIDVDAGAASEGTVRFVITGCPKDETAGNPHTYNLEAVEDMLNSSQYDSGD